MIMNFQTLVHRQHNKAVGTVGTVGTVVTVVPATGFFFNFHAHVTQISSFLLRIIEYRVIQNVCRGFNNLSYTIHLR